MRQGAIYGHEDPRAGRGVMRKGTVAAAFAVSLAFLAVAASYGAGICLPIDSSSSHLSAIPWDTRQSSDKAARIFEGNVEAIRTAVIENPYGEQNPSERILAESRSSYNLVTVRVTEWLKDSEGLYPERVTVLSEAAKGVSIDAGRCISINRSYVTEFGIGEKAIFFAWKTGAEYTVSGGLGTFRYDGDGLAYLPYYSLSDDPRYAPQDPEGLKDEIRSYQDQS